MVSPCDELSFLYLITLMISSRIYPLYQIMNYHAPNGDNVFDDDGWPLDFINTLRSWKEMREYFDCVNEEQKESEEGTQSFASIPDGNVFDDFPEDFLGATDLPF